MSKHDWNLILTHGMELIDKEAKRRRKGIDYDPELLNYDWDEFRYGVITGLEIAAKILEIAKVTDLKEAV